MPRTKQPRVPKKKVKLELFSLHGHIHDQPINYTELLTFMAGLALTACTEVTGDCFVRVRVTADQEGVFRFSAYTGSVDKTFLVLDLQDGTEEERGLEDGKLVVRKTVGLIDTARREAVVQLVHHGVQAY